MMVRMISQSAVYYAENYLLCSVMKCEWAGVDFVMLSCCDRTNFIIPALNFAGWNVRLKVKDEEIMRHLFFFLKTQKSSRESSLHLLFSCSEYEFDNNFGNQNLDGFFSYGTALKIREAVKDSQNR